MEDRRHFMRQAHMVGPSHPLNSDGLCPLQKDFVVEQQGLAGRAVVAGWVGHRALSAGLLPASGHHRNSGAEVQIDLETEGEAQS